jgi:uncharacterized surface protein with fasciclin (FAS1) repeats
MLHTKLLAAAATAALLVAPAAMAQTLPTEATPNDSALTSDAPTAANVIEALKANGQFTFLLEALKQAQLTETLATRDRITIFAPTDQVFAALPETERARLLDPANVQELRNLMLFHVLVADLRPDQIIGARGPIATAGGLEVHIDGTGDVIHVADATVTDPAIDVGNGNVYIIDGLLDPNSAAQGDTEEPAADTAPATPATTDDSQAAAAPSTPN